jgi:hypothetical protein
MLKSRIWREYIQTSPYGTKRLLKYYGTYVKLLVSLWFLQKYQIDIHAISKYWIPCITLHYIPMYMLLILAVIINHIFVSDESATGFKAAGLQKISKKLPSYLYFKIPPRKLYIVKRNRNNLSKCSYFNILVLKTNSSLSANVIYLLLLY